MLRYLVRELDQAVVDGSKLYVQLVAWSSSELLARWLGGTLLVVRGAPPCRPASPRVWAMRSFAIAGMQQLCLVQVP